MHDEKILYVKAMNLLRDYIAQFYWWLIALLAWLNYNNILFSMICFETIQYIYFLKLGRYCVQEFIVFF